MARPIRNTPILYGEDAKEFLRQINTPLPVEERRRRRREAEEAVKKLEEMIANLKRE